MAITVIPRPPVGVLVLPDGSRWPIDRPLLLGRNPSEQPEIDGIQGAAIRLPDPGAHLGRAHLVVTAVQWQVQLVDRGSRNGTVLETADGGSRRLLPEQRVPWNVGEAVVLGGTTRLVLEPPGGTAP